LEENPSYDVINDIYRDLKLFDGAYKQAIINPGIVLNAWMSTRTDAEIRLKTESIVSQCKPEEIYCGLLLARNSVVNLICSGNTKIKEPSEDKIQAKRERKSSGLFDYIPDEFKAQNFPLTPTGKFCIF